MVLLHVLVVSVKLLHRYLFKLCNLVSTVHGAHGAEGGEILPAKDLHFDMRLTESKPVLLVYKEKKTNKFSL